MRYIGNVDANFQVPFFQFLNTKRIIEVLGIFQSMVK